MRRSPVAGLIVLLCLIGVACGEDSGPSDQPIPSATLVATQASPSPPVPTPSTSAPTVVPTRPAGDTSVVGLFPEPRPLPAVQVRALGELPPPVFMPWDGVSTVLYDAQTRSETSMGPGSLGTFSPDSSRMAWVAGAANATTGEVWVIDLATGQHRSLGPGRTAEFFDNERVISFRPGSNAADLINVVTGAREPAPAPAPDVFTSILPDGARLRRTPRSDYPFPRNAFSLIGRDGRTVLEFEAYAAAAAGLDELVVMTPPENGMANIFVINTVSGRAEYIATARYVEPNMPLGASTDYVVWTDAYCGIGAARGKTRIFDRRSRAVTELDASLWVTMTPAGQIASGEFGARALIDPSTLQYTLTIPMRDPIAPQGGAGDVRWSLDYRYATRGMSGGHGGLCP